MNKIKLVEQQLLQAGFHSPQIWSIACWLASKATGLSSAQLLTTERDFLSEEQKLLAKLIYELTVLKKPLQYILGSVPFCGLTITVEPPVLIPRPETEEWVANLITQLVQNSGPSRILDIGTGSGCIALALAHELPHACVIGVDVAAKALELARKNQKNLGISNVSFVQADLFPALGQRFDVIVSNPPYISEREYEMLEPHVRLWEDKRALVADDNGLSLIKQIIVRARDYLNPDGHLTIEIGSAQADICTFMRSCGYTDVQVKKDFAHHDRVLVGRHEVNQKISRS